MGEGRRQVWRSSALQRPLQNTAGLWLLDCLGQSLHAVNTQEERRKPLLKADKARQLNSADRNFPVLASTLVA